MGITVDGPRGPRQQVKAGVLAVSRKTGAWIVPVCVAYERAWKLRTWDEMLVPVPFSAVAVRYGSRSGCRRTETRRATGCGWRRS